MKESTDRQDDGWMHRIELIVEDYPAMGIGTAMCLGVLLGWAIKRR